jgi:tetratricopeptide (TPR) repeat protein
LPAAQDNPTAQGLLARAMATLRYCEGQPQSLEELPAADRVLALANASAALAGRMQFTQAIAAYTQALSLAPDPWPATFPAPRALAVGGNNLAAALEEKAERSPFETQSMLMAAQSALTYWKLAGGWMEHERAEYRLTRSLLQANLPLEAIASAQRCIAVCQQNQASALELFFGHAVLALAYGANDDQSGFKTQQLLAQSQYQQVASDEKVWCQSELKELGLQA